MLQIRVFGFAMLTALFSIGCGDGAPDIATVKGTITLDGRPLANASVVFVPETGRPAGASTDELGNYVLNYADGKKGAIPGKNQVRISTHRDPSESPDGKPIPGAPEIIPINYNALSELKFVVEPGKKNVANFDLTSAGKVRLASNER